MKSHTGLRIVLVLVWTLLYILMLAYSCKPKVPAQQQVSQTVKDTFEYRVVRVEEIKGLVPEIGQKISLPSINVELERITYDKVLVKTPVQKKTIRESKTEFIPTKTVDKSDNRTYQDSYNQDRSKVKDQSNSGISGNKFTLGGWWLVLLAMAAGLLYYTKHYWLPIIRL